MYRAQDTREATNNFFCRAFIRKAMETLKESFFSLMSLNLIKKDKVSARFSTKKAIESLFHRSL